MASARPNVAVTMQMPRVFGTIWRIRIHRRVAPMPSAAWENSLVRSDSTWPRTSLATLGQDSRVRIRMMASRLSVYMLATMISRMKVGTASSVSMIRIRIASPNPPITPDIAPYRAPSTVLAMPTAKASSSEDWPPAISRPSTSMPY